MHQQNTTISKAVIGWFGVIEAAKYVGVGHNKMRELFKKSDFPCKWIGRKQVVKIEDLDKYIADGRAS